MEMADKYILDGHNAIPCDDLIKWAKWFEKADRIVVKTVISDNITVSTVFLGLNHNFGVKGKPLLFETLVFGGEYDGEMRRYSTWDKAEKGHKIMVEKVS